MATDILEMSVNLVTAHLTQNRMSAQDVPEFIRNIYTTLQDLKGAPAQTRPSSGAMVAVAQSQVTRPASAEEPAPQSTPPPIDAVDAPEIDGDTDSRPERIQSNKIAFVRDNDLTDPVFEGLDPWLAARISPKVARKLDPRNEVHPSVFPNHLICLEDGRNVTLLRAYIKNRFGLSPTEYAEKWNLPDEYPMAPPQYIADKRKLALKGGLGRSVRGHREKRKASKPDTQ